MSGKTPPIHRAILDDRLLIEQILTGIRPGRRSIEFHTTAYWYFRACRAAIAGAGGHLAGPFEQLDSGMQRRAIQSLLELPDEIALPDPRFTVPLMAEVSRRHPRLNLLNLEAVAAALVLQANVWLSIESASGVLPQVLDAEDIPWTVVTIP